MLTAYTGSKHAVIGLTKSAAREHAKDRINVNAVAPGIVYTGMTEDCMGLSILPLCLIRRLEISGLKKGLYQRFQTPRIQRSPHISRIRPRGRDLVIQSTSKQFRSAEVFSGIR